jgi:hypothetical protein
MNFKWIVPVSLIVLIGCSTNQKVSNGTVSRDSGEVPSEHGLYYNLPKTVIRVEMIAEKVVVKAGPFFRYSQRLLNITEVETENLEEWRIVGANVYTIGLPDAKRQYRVSTTGSPSMAALNLTSQGVLAGVNINDFSEPVFQDSVIKDIITSAQIDFNEVPYTADQLIKSSTAAMAEEVAKEIYRLRLLRNQILKGELETLPPDDGAYQLTLSEIDKQEQALVELFTGKVIKQTIKKSFNFTPESDQILNTVLLRFSPQNGFLDPMDVSGTPVYIEVDVNTKNIKDFVAEETSKSLNKTGLVYCIPVTAEVKIVDRTLLLTKKQVYLAQFGRVLRMPADLLNGPGVGVELDLSTGALKRVFYK